MSRKGVTLMTSKVAKSKTGVQLGIIIFILLFLSLKGIDWSFVKDYLQFVKDYQLVYYLAMIAAIFTVYTGFTYIQENRKAIREIMN